MDNEIRRVRTLPIPDNLFFVGLTHKNTQESNAEQKEMSMESATPFDLGKEFWIEALLKSEQSKQTQSK